MVEERLLEYDVREVTGIQKDLFMLANQLRLQRFSASQEKMTQNDVENYLKKSGYLINREKRLSQKDIPDFFIETPTGNIIIEVKVRCPRKAIYRQLERYSKYEEVQGLILISGTSIGLPKEIHGKPSVVVSLGEGWL